MKRSGPPRRSRPMARSTKPLAPVGAGKRKKMARYSAYLRSKVWREKRKAALARANGVCEFTVTVDADRWPSTVTPDVSFGTYTGIYSPMRCTAEATHVHHKTYARFGGDELPEDLQALCKAHHDYIEQRDHPHRAASRRQATPARTQCR